MCTWLCEELCIHTALSKFVGFQIASISVNDVLNVENELQKDKMLRFLLGYLMTWAGLQVS